MDERRATEPATMKNITSTARQSDRELVITRTFDAPARIVYDAWTKPELLRQWWTPKSFGITFLECEADVRPGGSYRFVFGVPGSDKPMAFFGRYLEAQPPSLLKWTNEEDEGGAVTTVTFEERDGKTHLTFHDLYPSKQALDDAIASSSVSGFDEQFGQLDGLIAGSAGS